MIDSVEVANFASYGTPPEIMSGLRRINFLFGPNGAGKSTIANVIADDEEFSSSAVTWENGTPLRRLIYNREFVRRTFDQSSEFKGVFTLGEDLKSTLREIESKTEERDRLTETIEGLRSTLEGEDGKGGKRGELARVEERFRERCWQQKLKHDEHFAEAFTGARGAVSSFKKKVIEEWESNTAAVLSLEDLVQKAESVFGSSTTTHPRVPSVDATELISLEEAPVLKKKVIGKSDVDLAAMIERLGNSDWVRQGRKFFEENDEMCPFCQQRTPDEFADQLADYFDETFEQDTQAISTLQEEYNTEAERLREQLEAILDDPPEFLEAEKLEAKEEILDSRIAENLQTLSQKQEEPSRSLSLKPLSKDIEEIQGLIDSANNLINEHNQLVSNLSEERSTLTAQVWKYLIEKELKLDLKDYEQDRTNLLAAIASLEQQIREAKKKKNAKIEKIQRLERQTTTVQPTIDEINNLLASVGFEGFSLAMAESGKAYRLIRPDGSDARETLSEGERAFVTFLYFLNLSRGSVSSGGVTTNRVVVFDDPVTSMDSNVLFVVASLIRRLISEVREDLGSIKQVFVFTHNVYFHREVTFDPSRSGADRRSYETFWTVRKRGGTSRLKKHEINPVTTSYEWLWAEVRDSDGSELSVRNTMRRILENYFVILGGGVNLHEICAEFEGSEKAVCRSLLSWVHAGSHHAFDDLYVDYETGAEEYFKVFKEIFRKRGQESHYNMMMRVEESEGVADASAG